MNEPIQVTSHVARDFLQNSAYFNTVPKIVWEYVSNSVDNPRPNQPVDVDVKISKERIVISDNGCGMSREELRNFSRCMEKILHARKVKALEVDTAQVSVLHLVSLMS